MENKISYEDQLELDALCREIDSYNNLFIYKKVFDTNISEVLDQLLENLKKYKFSNVLICYKKIDKYLNSINNDYYTAEDWNELSEKIEKIKTLCDDLIAKGFDNYQEEEVELTEKEKLKLQKQKADKRLKEIQEENSPYLNLSIGLSLALTAIVFMCIPTFFNSVALYHICGTMLTLGVFLLINEINVRQSLGWSNYSDKITSKRAFILLLQAIVYMIPLSVLFYFFSQVLIIRILFFIQVWFCSTLMINGISLLVVTNITKNKERKFNIWSFILGVITIAAFVLQLLQIFKVL